jgi:hypothetical protein
MGTSWVEICGIKGEIGFDATGIILALIFCSTFCSIFWSPVVAEIVHHKLGLVLILTTLTVSKKNRNNH